MLRLTLFFFLAFPAMTMTTNGHQYQSAGITANGVTGSGFASDDSFAKAFGGPGQQQASSGG